MAYADFTTKDLMRQFGVKFQGRSLFAHVPPVQASEWLTTTLEIRVP